MSVLDIAGFIIGIGGLLVGIWGSYIGHKGRQIQILEYNSSTSPIITNKINNIPELEITVGGEFVSDLALTKIEFTSRGNSTIKGSDFATLAPLQVISTGHFFNLETINEKSISSDNPNLNPTVKVVDKKTLNITFEYLKPKQSFSISILHDGEVSIAGDLKSGKLRQQQNHFEETEEKATSNKNSNLMPKYILISLIISSLIWSLILGYLFQTPIISISYDHDQSSIRSGEIKSQLMEAMNDKNIDQSELANIYHQLADFYLQIATSYLQDSQAEGPSK